MLFATISAARSESKPKLFIKTAATNRQVTSPSEVTSSSMSPMAEDTSELGVQLTVGRRLKHIAMKATFDQPRNRDGQVEVNKPSEFYASELLGSFIVERQSQPAATVVQAVEVPLSTLIVVGSPFSHTVHYINADQPHDDGQQESPSSTSYGSFDLSSPSPSSSSDSQRSSLRVSMFDSADKQTEVMDDVTSADSSDDRGVVADLAELDQLRTADLLPLPLCSESPWYLGLTDDELRRLLIDPDCNTQATTSDVDVGDLISATELSWPSPSADMLPSGQTSKSDVQDYLTPEVIELLGSLYDDWLRDDPEIGSFFSST